MGQKSRSKKQNRQKKVQTSGVSPAASAQPAAAKASVPGISLQNAMKAPAKVGAGVIDAGQYVRKDIRLITYLLAGVFVLLAALTVANSQYGFVQEGGQYLSDFLRF